MRSKRFKILIEKKNLKCYHFFIGNSKILEVL